MAPREEPAVEYGGLEGIGIDLGVVGRSLGSF